MQHVCRILAGMKTFANTFHTQELLAESAGRPYSYVTDSGRFTVIHITSLWGSQLPIVMLASDVEVVEQDSNGFGLLRSDARPVVSCFQVV